MHLSFAAALSSAQRPPLSPPPAANRPHSSSPRKPSPRRLPSSEILPQNSHNHTVSGIRGRFPPGAGQRAGAANEDQLLNVRKVVRTNFVLPLD